MIVDSHAHVNAPAELYAWQGHLVSNRANPDAGPPTISDAALEKSIQEHPLSRKLDTRAFPRT